MRKESDFLGERGLPDTAYYGIQTLRGKENFQITGIPMSAEPCFVKAFGYVKKAAALANRDLGVLDPEVANAISVGCDQLIAGQHLDQFVTDFIQGGAGTSTNMNANEVIANLALEHLGEPKGSYSRVNPNDHVNFGQSTNDVYPTAFRLALVMRLQAYIEALRKLQEAFLAKGTEFDRVLKMGRTHLQDAVPMSLGAEFRGWGTTMGEEVQRIEDVRRLLLEINLGGEEHKAGVEPAVSEETAEQLISLGVDLRGVMTVPPLGKDPRACFEDLIELSQRLQARWPQLREVSAGMSDDFEVAIEAGATMVRIGRAIFGPRKEGLRDGNLA